MRVLTATIRTVRGLERDYGGIGASTLAQIERFDMRYIAAWALGVPISLIALWFVVGHMACGR